MSDVQGEAKHSSAPRSDGQTLQCCEIVGQIRSQPANEAGKPDLLLLNKKRKMKKKEKKKGGKKKILTSLSS